MRTASSFETLPAVNVIMAGIDVRSSAHLGSNFISFTDFLGDHSVDRTVEAKVVVVW